MLDKKRQTTVNRTATTVSDSMALSNDELNVLPIYKNDYLDLEALKAAAAALAEPYLRGGKLSIKHVVKTRVNPALRLANYGDKLSKDEKTGLLESGQANGYESTGRLESNNAASIANQEMEGTGGSDAMDEDIRNFRERFRFEVLRVDRVYESELDKLATRFNKMEGFIQKLLASKGRQGLLLKIDELTPEFELIYRKAHHIENFALTNYSMALTVLQLPKVSSRFWSPGFLGERLLREELEPMGFTDALRVRRFMAAINRSYAQHYCDGNQLVAEHRLLRKHRDQIDWQTVLVGAWIGAALMGALWTLYAVITQSQLEVHLHDLVLDEDKTGGYRIFRATGLILLMFCGFCVQVGVWREARVNFPVIFGIPAVMFPSTSALFLTAARGVVGYFLCLILFVRSLGPHADIFPMIVLFAFCFFLLRAWYLVAFLPRRCFRQEDQTELLLTSVGETLKGFILFIAGVSEKTFLTAYIADYLTSSSKILADFAHISCNIFVRTTPNERFTERFRSDSVYCKDSAFMNFGVVPIIMCWPLWLRLGQNLSRLYDTGSNWPFLFNASKYALAHTITIFSTLHPELLSFSSDSGLEISLFVFSFVFTTFVTFTWDVFVDWGLGDFSNGGLRNILMFEPNRFLYYWAIIGDFFMRYLWTLQLIPSFQSIHSFLLSTAATTMLEVIRRTYWGLLRVENEMINNTRHYDYPARKVDGGLEHFIPLYFDAPFKVDLDVDPLVEKRNQKRGLSPAIVKTEIIIFLTTVFSLASIAIFYK